MLAARRIQLMNSRLRNSLASPNWHMLGLFAQQAINLLLAISADPLPRSPFLILISLRLQLHSDHYGNARRNQPARRPMLVSAELTSHARAASPGARSPLRFCTLSIKQCRAN